MTIVQLGRAVGMEEPATISMALRRFRSRLEPDPATRNETARAAEMLLVTLRPQLLHEDNLFALRSDVEDATIAVGDELTDANDRSFRVTAIEDSPNNLLVRLTVEAARA